MLDALTLEQRVAGLSLASCIAKRDGISFGTCTDWHYYIVLNSRVQELKALKLEAGDEEVIDLAKESDTDTPRTPV